MQKNKKAKVGDNVEVTNNCKKVIGEVIEVRDNGKILVSFKKFNYDYNYRNSSYLPHRYKIIN